MQDPPTEMKEAIERADVARLRSLLSEQPARCNEVISWGPGNKNVVPPLHYVCDVFFQHRVTQEQGLEMALLLLDAGVDFHDVYAKSGDTYLIAAASLGAELIGLRLVELGADVHAQGLFGATALHWTAMTGLPALAAALIEAGASTDLRDRKYRATPLEWARHALSQDTSAPRDGITAVATLLGGAAAR